MDAVTVSTALLLVFAALSSIDGLYIHLWRLRLHTRPASWREHLWHTARAVLFAPIVVLVFAVPSAGIALWTGVALIALDQLVEMLDVSDERTSRADLGGVSRGELALHVVLVVTRSVAVLLALAARPAAAWALDAPPLLGTYSPLVSQLVSSLVPGSIAVAALHLVLAWRHRPAACCVPTPA